jgi:threonine/homoserine/homoserine lactone efflux protein
MITSKIFIFTIVCLFLITPSHDVLTILKNGLSSSRRVGFLAVVGSCTGLAIHFAYLTVFIDYMIREWSFFYNIIRYAGTFYILYLGSRLLRIRRNVLSYSQLQAQVVDHTPLQAYFDGLISNLLNVRISLFFLALFAQLYTPSTTRGFMAVYTAAFLLMAFLIWTSIVQLTQTMWIQKLLQQAKSWIYPTLGFLMIFFSLWAFIKVRFS